MEWKIISKIILNRKVVKSTFLLFLFISSGIKAQEKHIRIYPTIGTSLRFGIMNFFNFKPMFPDNFSRPYNPQQNISGFSINPGLAIHYNEIEVEYFSGFRYDAVNYISGTDNKYAKSFLVDHNFNLAYRKKMAYGIGSSIVNTNKGYWYIDDFNNPIPKYHNIEFKTVNVFIQFPVYKIINLELKVQYMPNGCPYNREEKYIMYSLRLFYRLNFLNNRKKKE